MAVVVVIVVVVIVVVGWTSTEDLQIQSFHCFTTNLYVLVVLVVVVVVVVVVQMVAIVENMMSVLHHCWC